MYLNPPLSEDDDFGAACKVAADEYDFIDHAVLQRGPSWARHWYKFDLRYESDGRITMPVSVVAEFCARARQDPDVFDLAIHVAASRIRVGAALPPELGRLVAEWMDSTGFKSPSRRRQGKWATWAAHFTLWLLTRRVSNQCDLQLTESKHKKPGRGTINSVRVVHHVMQKKGLSPPSATRIQTIVTSSTDVKSFQEIKSLIYRAKFDNDPEVIRV